MKVNTEVNTDFKSKKKKFLTFFKMVYLLNLYLILPQEEWCWHGVRACAIQYQSENEKMGMDITFRKTAKADLF